MSFLPTKKNTKRDCHSNIFAILLSFYFCCFAEALLPLAELRNTSGTERGLWTVFHLLNYIENASGEDFCTVSMDIRKNYNDQYPFQHTYCIGMWILL